MNINPGHRIRDYIVVRQLGKGGMGEVWLARDIYLDREVAIKVLDSALTGDPRFSERFKNEAQIQNLLTHTNIVAFKDFFQEDGNWFLVQEYAQGITLRELINNTGPIREERTLNIFRQLTDALSYAHTKGIIHRDVKPSNIMVDHKNGDAVKVMDFGIARLINDIHLTQTGDTIGTVYYMSPEQVVAAKDIDQRSDIYSAGIVLYEMLSGRLPFNVSTSSTFHIQDAIVNKDVPDPRLVYPNISDRTVALLHRLTIKDREQRPHTFPDLNTFQITDTISKSQPFYPDPEPALNGTAAPSAAPQKKGKAGVWIMFGLILAIALTVFFVLRSQTGARELERVLQTSTFVAVQGGEFEMGSEGDNTDELPVHSVLVSGFYIANYEVTQHLWSSVMGENPSHNQGEALPVENVSWEEALEFCNALSVREGLQPCYKIKGASSTCNWGANGYRLPTEAEWEFAARGGNNSLGYVYSGSNDISAVAFSSSSDARRTSPVGQKNPNELGLHDMSGNVWEWCWDSYAGDYYRVSPYENPRGAKAGHVRCMRGGAWDRNEERCRNAYRGKGSFEIRRSNIGFRLVRSSM
ncbi:MAG: Serine/threonine-protein kinase PrkC [Candidatus Cloacimonetes bacterium ADurb.Bin117]|nr:MAG: Serine/threonine-protein kinase PrkC [Candidatus Cloacimonetes bacterium ADurb.Bin117]